MADTNSMNDILRSANASRRSDSKTDTAPSVHSETVRRVSKGPVIKKAQESSAPVKKQTKAEIKAQVKRATGGSAGTDKSTLDIDHPCYHVNEHEVCPLCHGMKHVFQQGKGWVRCSCFSGQHYEDLFDFSDWPMPGKMLLAKPKDFVMTNPSLRKLGDFIEKAHKDSSLLGNSFLLTTGFMKEIALSLLVKVWVFDHAQEVKSVAFSRLSDAVVPYYTPSDQLDEDVGSFRSLLTSDVLVLLFGDEATNNGHKTVLHELLYNRNMAGKMTFAATDLSMNEIASRYGRPHVSALSEFTAASF